MNVLRSEKWKMPSGGKKANAQQSFDELKLRYMTVDRNYEALKTLTRRG